MKNIAFAEMLQASYEPKRNRELSRLVMFGWFAVLLPPAMYCAFTSSKIWVAITIAFIISTIRWFKNNPQI